MHQAQLFCIQVIVNSWQVLIFNICSMPPSQYHQTGYLVKSKLSRLIRNQRWSQSLNSKYCFLFYQSCIMTFSLRFLLQLSWREENHEVLAKIQQNVWFSPDILKSSGSKIFSCSKPKPKFWNRAPVSAKRSGNFCFDSCSGQFFLALFAL